MVKKYLPYIIIAIICFIIGFFISSRTGNSTDADDRISKLEGIATEIRDTQRSINTGIESLGLELTRIRSDTIKLAENNKRIEIGISGLQNDNRKNGEIIGNLVRGNTELKELAKDYRDITGEFGQIITGIEEGNK